LKPKRFKESERIALLAFRRDDAGKVGTDGRCPESGTIAEAYFPEDNRESEALLGMIVRGLHAVDVKESENARGITQG
jgi:hypothetical protein